MSERTGHRVPELPGLQNERTALSWQRTALSLIAGGAAVSRLTYAELGGLALLCTGLTLVLGGVLFWTSRTRYRRRGRLTAGPGHHGGGRNAAFASLIVLTLVCTELVAIALR